ncbi:MAG TPA: hypothetical protein PKN96_00745 [Flavobacterium sp.]|uniref:hypothetical protein n=1 Tax=Flavobacterium sp. TaxID=239 RepID=UPI002C3949F5|nr:hypothetical protein [Flavobacterium sp.]HNP31798.1 hypothetical protein [Flavobacterium sp.]
MNKKQLAEILKYCSPKILYIVTWNNLLKKLFCPFKVRVLNPVGELREGEIVWVEEIKVTPELKTIFVIKGQAYYYYHFDIII